MLLRANAPSSGQTAHGYLTAHGFGWIDEIGYYTPGPNSGSTHTDTADASSCSEDLNTLVQSDPSMRQCNNLPDAGRRPPTAPRTSR
ncbi:MAG TPA: hypothetical protein VGS19_34490 [Streptosporangiaceae bacterium]|nr:hypothetical protein [Streptosporangiaceae bacterium]